MPWATHTIDPGTFTSLNDVGSVHRTQAGPRHMPFATPYEPRPGPLLNIYTNDPGGHSKIGQDQETSAFAIDQLASFRRNADSALMRL